MKKGLFLLTLVLSIFSEVAFSQTKKVLELESLKTSLIKKVASLLDSITKVEKEIEGLKANEILSKVSDSTLRGFTIKGAKLKKAPDPQEEVLILFDEGKEVVIIKNELVDEVFDMSKLMSEVNEEERKEIPDVIFEVVETQPNPPGGMVGWNKYLAENMKYPEEAKKMGVQGTVIIVFVITTDGFIKDVEVLRGIGGGCDEEAIRVVKNGPKWEPGKQRGEPVNTRMRLPLKFKLD